MSAMVQELRLCETAEPKANKDSIRNEQSAHDARQPKPIAWRTERDRRNMRRDGPLGNAASEKKPKKVAFSPLPRFKAKMEPVMTPAAVRRVMAELKVRFLGGLGLGSGGLQGCLFVGCFFFFVFLYFSSVVICDRYWHDNTTCPATTSKRYQCRRVWPIGVHGCELGVRW